MRETPGAGVLTEKPAMRRTPESRRQRLMIEQRAIEAEEKLAAAVTDWETRTMHFPKPIAAALGAAPCPGK